MYFNIKKQKGFTILEVLAVISIVTIGLVGLISLINQNIHVNYINKSKIIAIGLAQEGIELVRKVRDDNWLEGNAWDKYISPTDTEGTFAIASSTNIFIDKNCNNITDSECRLRKTSNGFYNHTSGTNTQFYRLITVKEPNNYELIVMSKVQWRTANGFHNVVAEEHLYNWK